MLLGTHQQKASNVNFLTFSISECKQIINFDLNIGLSRAVGPNTNRLMVLA